MWDVSQHFMHKSSVVREKLRAKDSNLSALLISSALKKSENELNILEDEEDQYCATTSLLHGESGPFRETWETDYSERDTDVRDEAGVTEEDITLPNGGRLDSKAFDLKHTSERMLFDSRQLLKDDGSLIREVMRSQQCSKVLQPYRCVYVCDKENITCYSSSK